MTKRVERPTSAPNACFGKSELYAATMLPDAELAMLMKHVGLKVNGEDDELPQDASKPVKHLATKMLATYEECEDKYLKRCKQNFKNRTGENADDDNAEAEQPTNDRQSSDERPQNKSNQNNSNQDNPNKIKDIVHSVPSVTKPNWNEHTLKQVAYKYGYGDFCDQSIIQEFMRMNNLAEGKDSKGQPIKSVSKAFIAFIRMQLKTLIECSFNEFKTVMQANNSSLPKKEEYMRYIVPRCQKIIETETSVAEKSLYVNILQEVSSYQDNDEQPF